MSQLSEAARLEYCVTIGISLPLPSEPTEARRASCLATAIEAFDALRPGNAYEAMLAVQIVVCGAHAVDCLHQAGEHHDDFNKMGICRNQAACMLREARAAKRILAQEQRLRLATEAVAATHWRQPAASVPAQRPRAASMPAGAAVEQAPGAAAEHPTVLPRQAVAGGASPPPAPAGAASPPTPDAIAQAESFALDHVLAAAQIREDRGVTPQNQALFRGVKLPADPAVMEALVRGSSPILDALDGLNQELLADAA